MIIKESGKGYLYVTASQSIMSERRNKSHWNRRVQMISDSLYLNLPKEAVIILNIHKGDAVRIIIDGKKRLIFSFGSANR